MPGDKDDAEKETKVLKNMKSEEEDVE